MRMRTRIAAYERAAAYAVDPQVIASKISDQSKSDRKKYKFAKGLARDLEHTRAALGAITAAHSEDNKNCYYCTTTTTTATALTFGELYSFTEGRIANLNRVLQNMKRANEIHFAPECFFDGVHDDEVIQLLEKFWVEAYKVEEENVFRPGRSVMDVPEEDRKGRSYVAEERGTRHVWEGCACGRQVKLEERITVRARVFHLSCISCVVCGTSPRQKKDYITFEGRICCSSVCIQKHDGVHLRQQRL